MLFDPCFPIPWGSWALECRMLRFGERCAYTFFNDLWLSELSSKKVMQKDSVDHCHRLRQLVESIAHSQMTSLIICDEVMQLLWMHCKIMNSSEWSSGLWMCRLLFDKLWPNELYSPKLVLIDPLVIAIYINSNNWSRGQIILERIAFEMFLFFMLSQWMFTSFTSWYMNQN